MRLKASLFHNFRRTAETYMLKPGVDKFIGTFSLQGQDLKMLADHILSRYTYFNVESRRKRWERGTRVFGAHRHQA